MTFETDKIICPFMHIPAQSTEPDAALSIITDPSSAVALLKEPRRRLLELAARPVTAVDLADQLGETRQKVGYHVRQLVEAGLLEDVEVGRQGARIDKTYRASAASYTLAPSLLGDLAAGLDSAADRESASYLVGALHEVQNDLAGVLARRTDNDERLPTLTLSTKLRFRDAAERGAFADALVRALTDVVARHSTPYEGDTDEAEESRAEPFRLTLTLNPTPS